MKTANNLFARLFTRMLTRIVLLITIVACTLPVSLASERDRLPEPAHAGLTAAWNLVGCGERYKQVWFGGEAVRGAGKTYSELLQSYNQAPTGSGCDEVDGQGSALKHIEYFVLAASAFQILVDSNLTGKNKNLAEWGLQESLNYLAEGKLLKGNDLLINGLRSRFKSDDSQTKTQIELLGDSVTEMKDGLAELTPYMIGYGTVLRSRSDNPTERFPFMVENTQGPKVPNEYQRYAELLNRYGMAANSEAKYIYYKDNVNDVDNPPYKNFPGPEDLDFNNDRIQNQAGRLDAAKRAKKVGSHLYLQSLTLAVMQNADDFQTNNGYQIKRQINDSDRLYQDIQSGFNPLLLAGDFVPYQRVENFLQLARARVNDATQAEQLARANQRTFETDETSLKTELRQQTSQYIDQLVELAGVSSADFDLTTKEGRDEYKTAAFISSWHERQGQIGIQVIALEEADLQMSQIWAQMQVVHGRAKIEQDRGRDVGTLVMKNGRRISVLQFMNTMASCCNVSTGTSTGTSKGTSSGSSTGTSIGSSTGTSHGASFGKMPSVNIGFSQGQSTGTSTGTSEGTSEGQSWGISEGASKNPDIEQLAQGQSAMALLQAVQQSDIEGLNSDATYNSIMLEMTTLYVSMDQARTAKQRQYAVIETLFDQFERILANYAVAQEDFSDAYYNNPAYRVEASRAEQAAEDTFETALELSYYAAKSMEYMWSEKYNNPVLRLDGGLPEPLAISFDPFVRAESVFSAQFASTYSPSLDDYLDGLQAWDVKMRQLRYPERQTSRVRFSMRDDLLGFGEFTPNVAEAKFRSFIDDKRNIGENVDNPDVQFQFSMDIADERLFPNHPNIKIESIAVNLVSTASRSIRGSSKTVPALVDLVMLDRAFIRTFFAEYPARDDILSYTLQQGRTIEKSPFIATVDATVDGYASPQVDPNTQLASHSPAVSTWVLRMKNNRFNNRDLKLQYLSDIEIDIQYSYGKPRDIQFSN
ncbi:MAG: hypothetical protein ACI910_002327 [Oleispira sp.]|jgi:hypothetical protein